MIALQVWRLDFRCLSVYSFFIFSSFAVSLCYSPLFSSLLTMHTLIQDIPLYFMICQVQKSLLNMTYQLAHAEDIKSLIVYASFTPL